MGGSLSAHLSVLLWLDLLFYLCTLMISTNTFSTPFITTTLEMKHPYTYSTVTKSHSPSELPSGGEPHLQSHASSPSANKVISPNIFSTPSLSIKIIIIFSTHITSTSAFFPMHPPPPTFHTFFDYHSELLFQNFKNIFLYANEWSWICFKRKQKMLQKWFFLYVYIHHFLILRNQKTSFFFLVFITKDTHTYNIAGYYYYYYYDTWKNR